MWYNVQCIVAKMCKFVVHYTDFSDFERGTFMKSTGIVRKVDELGRIVLPVELRKTMNINIKDPLEIFVEGKQIILQKYEESCFLCGNNDKNLLIFYRERNICKNCIKEIGKVK